MASPMEPELIRGIIIIQSANKDILLPGAEEACKTVTVQKKIMHKRGVRDRRKDRQGQAEGHAKLAEVRQVSSNFSRCMS